MQIEKYENELFKLFKYKSPSGLSRMAFPDWLPYSWLMQSRIKAQREPLSLSQIRDDAKRYGNKPPGTAFDKF